MRFLILIFVLFLGCEDDPLSPEGGDSSVTGVYDNCDVEYIQLWGEYYDVESTTEINPSFTSYSSGANAFPLYELQCFEQLTSLDMNGPIEWLDDIAQLTNLTHLTYNTSSDLCDDIEIDMSHLTSLEFRFSQGYCEADIEFPLNLENLTHLSSLYIDYNKYYANLNGKCNIPSDIYSLTNLTELIIQGDFTGDISSDIQNLVNLEILDLHNMDSITGSIPPEIGNLVNLEILDLYDMDSITGSIPPEIGNLVSLTYLDISGCDLISGLLPPEIGNLVNLEKLDLRSMNSITPSSIPSEFFNLVNLIKLDLAYNDLTGSIPPEIANLVNLEELDLANNDFDGTSIPSEIGNLTNLTKLYIYRNQLTGSIPSEIGNLVNLETLSLYDNDLTGSIPSEIGNLVNLTNLDLESNELTGSIPPEIGNLINLTNLELDDNQLSGLIPPEICSQGDSTPDIEDNNLCPDNFNEYPACDGIPITSTSEQNISECGK